MQHIAAAERELDEGRAGEAASLVRAKFPQVRTLGGDAAPLAVLEGLDQRGLLGSAFAYLALSRARAAGGDAGGAQAAIRRCSMMSSDKRRCVLDFFGEPVAGGRG